MQAPLLLLHPPFLSSLYSSPFDSLRVLYQAVKRNQGRSRSALIMERC